MTDLGPRLTLLTQPAQLDKQRFVLEWALPLEPGLETHVTLYDSGGRGAAHGGGKPGAGRSRHPAGAVDDPHRRPRPCDRGDRVCRRDLRDADRSTAGARAVARSELAAARRGPRAGRLPFPS
jgi:hypothetical protein